MELEFNLRESKSGGRVPLMIMIHGFGANKNDLFGLKNFFPEGYNIIALDAPNQMLMGGKHWYNIEWIGNDKRVNLEEAKKSKEMIISFIENAKEKYNPSEIILLGFSQGTILAYSVLFDRPDLLDTLIAFSGYIDERLINYSGDNQEIRMKDIFISHGLFDEVIEPKLAEESSKILKEKSINHFFKIYPLAHSLNEDIIQDLLNWMNERKSD